MSIKNREVCIGEDDIGPIFGEERSRADELGGGRDSAFPQSDLSAYGMGPAAGSQTGMSLRDYLAAKAMQAIFAGAASPTASIADYDSDWAVIVANRSYQMADAMLKERNR